jgi:OOP family OmpA-OmpF porin
MITEKLGVKAHYAFNRFSNSKDSDMGMSFNRVGVEGVANVGKLLNVSFHLRERFGLLFHTGAGITFAKPSSVDGTDHIGNILVGFTGQIKLNENFTLLGDLTYVANLKQQYAYDGELINGNYDPVPGSFVNLSFGIMYNFGFEKYHADWY